MTIHRFDPAPTPESDEQLVRDVIDTAMSGTRPPLDLPAAALTRGRRLRARRRVAVASAAVAASVLVAMAAAWTSPSTRGTSGQDVMATQPPAPAPTALQGWWDMPAREMVDAVEAILPDGVTLIDPGPLVADTPEGGPASGSINSQLVGPGGPGQVNVVLWRDFTPDTPDPAAEAGATAEPTPDGHYNGPDGWLECPGNLGNPQQCTLLRDDAGVVIGRRSVSRIFDLLVFEVHLVRNDGAVYAASANTIDDKWDTDSPVSANRPPLSLDQLEDLVRNDVWVSYHP